jgi:hypothetical protein
VVQQRYNAGDPGGHTSSRNTCSRKKSTSLIPTLIE